MNSHGIRRFLAGKLTEDSDGAVAFQCLDYGSYFGIAGEPNPVALTRDQLHILPHSSDDDDDEELEDLHNSKSERYVQSRYYN